MLIRRMKMLSVAVLLLGIAMLLFGAWQNAFAAGDEKPKIVILTEAALTPALLKQHSLEDIRRRSRTY